MAGRKPPITELSDADLAWNVALALAYEAHDPDTELGRPTTVKAGTELFKQLLGPDSGVRPVEDSLDSPDIVGHRQEVVGEFVRRLMERAPQRFGLSIEAQGADE